jgi:exopolyphosphatase / guanosine-5'-triphosphate,3'-diphosphate pyrophosphatase
MCPNSRGRLRAVNVQPVTQASPVPAIAVVDIGSNSGRVVVYEFETFAHFRILSSGRTSLRLVRDLDRDGRLGDDSIAHALGALSDFHAIATGSGAQRIIAVATAAVREASNGAELIERIKREIGLEVRVIDGQEEARYGFVGAVRALPVESGLLFDMGGGSAQIIRFHKRKMMESWSLPMGALRLSVNFLSADPPKRADLKRLGQHVRKLIEGASIPPLRRGEHLVGTGGTVRNLARIDVRASGYPISRLHGYVLERSALRTIAQSLADKKLAARGGTAGLNRDRSDSIVGGAYGIKALMRALGADQVLVSGQGVREGLISSLLSDRLPDVTTMRASSISALTSRFNTWGAASAALRVAIARALFESFEPEPADQLEEALGHAANLLDIGRAVDFFNRYDHAADMVMGTELNGFSHHEVALLSAILRRAKDETADVQRYRPVLPKSELPSIDRAGVLLYLADELEKRCTLDERVAVDCKLDGDEAIVRIPQLRSWRDWPGEDRFFEVFGRKLRVERG